MNSTRIRPEARRKPAPRRARIPPEKGALTPEQKAVVEKLNAWRELVFVRLSPEEKAKVVQEILEFYQTDVPSIIGLRAENTDVQKTSKKDFMGDAPQDLNALAANLGLSFEEAAEKLTAAAGRKKKDDPLSRARQFLASFDRRQAKNPDLPVPKEVTDARSFVNRANYQNRKAKTAKL